MSDEAYWKRRVDEINRSHGGYNPGNPHHVESRRGYEHATGLSGVTYGPPVERPTRTPPGHTMHCSCSLCPRR